jgi:hypothetical protein
LISVLCLVGRNACSFGRLSFLFENHNMVIVSLA